MNLFRSTLYRFGQPLAAALPLPRGYGIQISLDLIQRRRLAMAIAALGVIAVTVYVVAVNNILLSGERIRREQLTARSLERENSALRELVSQRQSPLWLEARSRERGMTEAGAIRYLTGEDSFARSR